MINQIPREIDILDKNDGGCLHIDEQNCIPFMINTNPLPVIILNKDRQIVTANKPFYNYFNIQHDNSITGKLFGETTGCHNFFKNGCGRSDGCQFCKALDIINRAINENRSVTDECRLVLDDSNTKGSYEFRFTAYPFTMDGCFFIIVYLFDISDTKRRRILERVFLHDLLNTAGALSGFIELYDMIPDPNDKREIFKDISNLSATLIDEIYSHKDILSAENSELQIRTSDIKIEGLIKQILFEISTRDFAKGKSILIDPDSQIDISFNSDRVIIKRILHAMIKNGMEASVKGETVYIGTKKETIITNMQITGQQNEQHKEQQSEQLVFYVKNSQFIPHQIALQIFQRGFSTKGTHRGVGTFSMRLFAENFLHGTVDFVTDEIDGTTFFLSIPYIEGLNAK